MAQKQLMKLTMNVSFETDVVPHFVTLVFDHHSFIRKLIAISNSCGLLHHHCPAIIGPSWWYPLIHLGVVFQVLDGLSTVITLLGDHELPTFVAGGEVYFLFLRF